MKDDEFIPGDDENFRLPVDENGDLALPEDDEEALRIMKIFYRRVRKYKDVLQFTDEQIADGEASLKELEESIERTKKAKIALLIARKEEEEAAKKLDETLANITEQKQFPANALRAVRKRKYSQ